MRRLTKKLCLPLILVVVLALCFAQLYTGCVGENSDADEVLVFLEEVVSLDLAEYNMTLLGTSVTYPEPILEGSPQYLNAPSANIRDLACDFLQRYQAYSGDSELEAMRRLLDVADVTENSTKTVDNMKLTVSINSFSSSFDWRYTLDGADYGGVDVSFRNGHFYAFGDDRSYYQTSTQ